MATKVKDSIGNNLQEGSLLFWKAIGAVVKVRDIKHGGIAVIGGAKDNSKPGAMVTPGELVLEIRLPFDPSQPETFLKDFIAIQDPEKQAPALSHLSEMPVQERKV